MNKDLEMLLLFLVGVTIGLFLVGTFLWAVERAVEKLP